MKDERFGKTNPAVSKALSNICRVGFERIARDVIEIEKVRRESFNRLLDDLSKEGVKSINVAVLPNIRFGMVDTVQRYLAILVDYSVIKGKIYIIANVEDVWWYTSTEKAYISVGDNKYYVKFTLCVGDMFSSESGKTVGKRLLIEVVE